MGVESLLGFWVFSLVLIPPASFKRPKKIQERDYQMPTFKDKIDQEWSFSIDLGTLHDITKHDGIDFSGTGAEDINLLDPTEKTLEYIMFKPMITVSIIWFCVKDQLDGKNFLQKYSVVPGAELGSNGWIDPDTNQTYRKVPFSESVAPDIDFYRLFSQEIIEEVATLLMHEVTSFFPLLTICIPKLIQTYSKAKTVMTKVLTDEEIMTDQEMEKLLRRGLQKNKEELIDSGI